MKLKRSKMEMHLKVEAIEENLDTIQLRKNTFYEDLIRVQKEGQALAEEPEDMVSEEEQSEQCPDGGSR